MALNSERKQRIKDRDGNRCVKCKSREQLTVDHIIPKDSGGTDEASNLQTLCRGCNVMKANKPPKHRTWLNFLFSRKTIYEFKNEIRAYVVTKNGELLSQAKGLIEEQQTQITQLYQQLKTQQDTHTNQINKLSERIRALQDYHKLDWHEETIKEYRKKPKKPLTTKMEKDIEGYCRH